MDLMMFFTPSAREGKSVEIVHSWDFKEARNFFYIYFLSPRSLFRIEFRVDITVIKLAFHFSFVQFSMLFCFSFQTLRDSLDCMYDARIPTHWKKVYR